MHFWKKRSDGLSREDIRLIKANCKQVVHQEELAIKRFEEAIEKINEFFNRRYPANTSASINLLTLNNIDEVFFLLRDLIHKDVSMSTIDEIAMKKDNGLKQSNPLFNYAYKENQFFRARKHKKTKFSDFKNPPKIITCGED